MYITLRSCSSEVETTLPGDKLIVGPTRCASQHTHILIVYKMMLWLCMYLK